MNCNNSDQLGEEIHKPSDGSLSETHLRNQIYMDRLWIVIIGGIIGELLGMYLGRIWLSVEVMYGCFVSGLLLGGLIAAQYSSKLKRLILRLVGKFTSTKSLDIAETNTLIEHYSTRRRWIACENVIRSFLAQHGGAFKSPNLAKQIKTFSPGFTYCKNQVTHLAWYLGAGISFVVIAYNVNSGQSELPNLLEEAVPFLPRLNTLNTEGVATILWFILIYFSLSVVLLLIGRQIPRKAILWALLGCGLLMVLPVLQYGLSILADTEFVTENSNVAALIERYPLAYLSEIAAGFVFFAKTGFLWNFWQALLVKRSEDISVAIPPLFLIISILVIVYGQDLAILQYLPESLCFLFLLSVGGCFHHADPEIKQAPWFLIPCGGIVAAILTVRLDSPWFSLLSLAAVLGITGFLVSPKKTLSMLWLIMKLLVIVIAICQCIRWYCNDSAQTALTLVSMWSIVGTWHICSQPEGFNGTFLLRDFVHKAWLRRRYKNTDFMNASLVDTEWYKLQSQTSTPTPPPLQTSTPTPPPLQTSTPIPPPAQTSTPTPPPPRKPPPPPPRKPPMTPPPPPKSTAPDSSE